jgi:hypothetical protein
VAVAVAVEPEDQQEQEATGAAEHGEGEGIRLEAAVEIPGSAGHRGVVGAVGQERGALEDQGVVAVEEGREEPVQLGIAGVGAGKRRAVGEGRKAGRGRLVGGRGRLRRIDGGGRSGLRGGGRPGLVRRRGRGLIGLGPTSWLRSGRR